MKGGPDGFPLRARCKPLVLAPAKTGRDRLVQDARDPGDRQPVVTESRAGNGVALGPCVAAQMLSCGCRPFDLDTHPSSRP